MEIKKETLPPVYAIWAQSRPDGPLQGRSGFLWEDGQRLQFPSQQAAKQKIQDLEDLRLCRVPTTAYRCVAYPGGDDAGPGIALEQIKAHDLRPDFGSMDYEIIQRIYGDTGGGCMVGTLAVRLTGLDKTVWINCGDEGVTVTASDYVWNEDHSGAWARYEDVVMLEFDFSAHSPPRGRSAAASHPGSRGLYPPAGGSPSRHPSPSPQRMAAGGVPPGYRPGQYDVQFGAGPAAQSGGRGRDGYGMTLTMGSLFDGIGGFPLAAARFGINTVWASEIEPFPMAVTKRRFPAMVQVGDLTKLEGEKLPLWTSSAEAAPART